MQYYKCTLTKEFKMTEKLKDQKVDNNMFVKESDYDLTQPHIMKMSDAIKRQEAIEAQKLIQEEIDASEDLADGLFKGLQKVNQEKADKLAKERRNKNKKITSKLKK